VGVKGSVREGKVGEYSRKDIAETPINQIDSEAELSSRSPRKTVLASLKSVVMICSVSTKELLSIGTIHHQSEGC
jgi:CO dehydrogenase nickel-insertion accessory protein CooC1